MSDLIPDRILKESTNSTLLYPHGLHRRELGELGDIMGNRDDLLFPAGKVRYLWCEAPPRVARRLSSFGLNRSNRCRNHADRAETRADFKFGPKTLLKSVTPDDFRRSEG